MSGLEFTDDAARELEKLYLTRDIVAQRAETIRQLAPCRGERILDVGCGPGFLCQSLAEVVGRDGSVTGIDVSDDLISLCRGRNPPEWLEYAVEDATSIARPDASFDAVACIQVAEYIPAVGQLLSEIFRVLRPDGRAVIVATDWDALVWHSKNPERMDRILRAWDAHCAHPHLPRSLCQRLVSTGFRTDGVAVFPILNLEWHDDAYSKGLARLIRDFVKNGEELAPGEIDAWHAELADLSEAGQYFFSSNRYIFRAAKPAC